SLAPVPEPRCNSLLIGVLDRPEHAAPDRSLRASPRGWRQAGPVRRVGDARAVRGGARGAPGGAPACRSVRRLAPGAGRDAWSAGARALAAGALKRRAANS